MQNKTIKLSLISVAFLSQLNASETIKLKDIQVISATKSTQSIKDTTSNIDVITSTEIEEKHYSSVSEALNSISGINFTANGGLGKNASVKIRGFDTKRVLVMIDGIRYNDLTGISGAPFSHLMINDIDRIEVLKGSQSGIWGADASAGAINIITKAAKDGFSGFINSEYGSFNTKKYGGGISYKTDKYYMKASIQKVDTDGFTAKLPYGDDIDSYEDDGYKNVSTNLKFGFNINDTNKIDISHTIIDATNEYDGYSDANEYKIGTTNDAFSKINFNHIDSFNELDIYASRSKFERGYPQDFTKEFAGEVYEYGIKSNIKYSKEDFLIVGVDYKSFEQEKDLVEKYNNKALFATNSNKFDCPLGGKMILTESLRYDSFNKFSNKTTGKIGLKRVINNDLYISANYGTAYNIPTLFNLYSPAYGNANLNPENSSSYDLSVVYKDLKLTYFDSKIKDMIDYYDPDGWGGIAGQYKNVTGSTKIKGVEVQYSKNLTENIFVTSNYTYLNTKDSSGNELSSRPKHLLKAAIDYYGIEDLHLGLNGEYVGLNYSYSGTESGKYTVVNLVVNYDLNENILLYAKVDNLFDKYYQETTGYAAAPLSGYFGFKANF